MAALLEVLIGTDVNENLVVMVDNQSILREISRWVGEGDRTFLALSANPDILRMIIGRLCMTTRSNRMVFSWIDGQKKARTSTWNQGVRNGVRLGTGRYRFEARLQQGVRNYL